MADTGAIQRMCVHCGAPDATRLGACHVCHASACDRCGNIQFCQGVKKVVHDECLKREEAGFSMIKFIK